MSHTGESKPMENHNYHIPDQGREQATGFRDGDQLDFHRASSNVISLDELAAARKAASEPVRVSYEVAIPTHEKIAAATASIVELRQDKLQEDKAA